MTRSHWPPGLMRSLVGSPTVGQHDEDEGLRTDGRPREGEAGPPKRTKRLFTMLAPEDVERLQKWAEDRGLSKSTANALILRKQLDEDGY